MATPSQPETRVPANDNEDPTSKMSFFDHLVELRQRILYSVIAIGGGLCVGLYFADDAFLILAKPMQAALREAKLADKLIYTSPLGPIQLYITVGLYLGFVLASPFVLHQVWLFLAPGLYRHERRSVLTFMLSSIFLFLAGTAFGYFVLLPMTLSFLVSIPGPFTAMISINDYFDMILVILLGLGVVFQLPILVFFLTLFRIVTPAFLWNNFRYAVLVIAILAAVVTPTTDILTMVIFMAPMLALYVLSIGVSALVVRKRQAEAGEASAGAGAGTVVIAISVLGAGAAALLWAGQHFGWWRLLR
ncbi:MAG: twin-arginine translocase subunit TatC [Acidobacteria bacterium]|nr:twin-arginine translocase subunit TatC [Acidobacteriota bacterium]MBI3663700.1 twin-arginine translocase subunit TatC [Acidobacteriota bacterium]